MIRQSLSRSAWKTVGAGLLLFGCLLFVAPASFASFGLNGVSATAVNADGSVDLQAGSHPYEYTVNLSLNHNSSGNLEGTLRDLVVELPPGLIGDPQALPQCPGDLFEGLLASCPGDTQVGIVEVKAENLPVAFSSVYNLAPSKGSAATIGTTIFSINSIQEASIRSGSDFGVDISDLTLPTNIKLQSISERIWGTPSDPGHDAERECRGPEDKIIKPCASDAAPTPFFTLPTSCTGPLKTTVSVDSVEEPDVFQTETVDSLDDGGQPAGLNACERVPFDPSITVQPQTSAAESPTGLHVNIHVPQDETQGQLATAALKDTTLTLPAGMVVNPSSGTGLAGCSPAQIDLHGAGAANCPDASKLGTAEIQTPLLDHPVKGEIYLATQGTNPFGSLLALYIAVDDPISGVVVKLSGKAEPDPVTGQLKTTFLNNPQLPFENLNLDLSGGPRSPLTTPLSCGAYTTTSDMTPWTTPEGGDVFPADTFQINTAANNGACVSSEAQEPNAPSFEAGTTTPLAGSYSPFVLKLNRENGSQHLSAINVTLPAGLTGKIAGVAQCSDSQIAAAAARKNPGEGALEQANPSCPAGSDLGTATVGVGSGSPLYVAGDVYLAGPYRGAPFSLAIITPAIAGPLDLGTVVVRSGLYINPETTQVTVKSDPLPTILEGIPLDIRSIAISMTRPGFMLNPTSCAAMALTGQSVSTAGQTAALANRFQVGGCAGLAFKPALTATTQAKTSRSNGASLVIKIAQKAGEANIHKVMLQIPADLPTRLSTLQKACTEAQFNTNPAGCPEGSVIGSATAHTPLLAAPLVGPAILVSHGGAAFPDVEFLLSGENVQITLDGKTEIKKGITYSRFETVPDAPITAFETVLPEGPHSILGANGDLCDQALVVPTTIVGQNGAQLTQSTKVATTGCSKPTVKVVKAKISHGAVALTFASSRTGTITFTSPGLKRAERRYNAGRHTIRLALNSIGHAAHNHHSKIKIKLTLKTITGTATQTNSL